MDEDRPGPPTRIRTPDGRTIVLPGPICATPGCWATQRLTECTIAAWGEGEQDYVEWFCSEHAYGEGFCWCCGGFWAGVESFDFNNPSELCENCRDNEYDDDDEEDGYYDTEYDYSQEDELL